MNKKTIKSKSQLFLFIGIMILNYSCINKYSVFICLINWEAEQIHSLTEREKFTSSILEEYVQHSVMNPRSSQKA